MAEAIVARYLGCVRRRSMEVNLSQVCEGKRKRPEEEEQPAPNPLRGKARRLLITGPDRDRCDPAGECDGKEEDPRIWGKAGSDSLQDLGVMVEDPAQDLDRDWRMDCFEALPVPLPVLVLDDLSDRDAADPVLEERVCIEEGDGKNELTTVVVPPTPDPSQIIVFNHKTKGPVPTPTLENYRIESVEGSGAYSVVYKANRICDGRLFAVKCPLQGTGNVDKEIKLLKLFGGKHSIIKLEEVIADGDNKYLVLEHVDHDNLQTLKKRITISDLRCYGFHLFKSLNYMHQKKIAHRDVKPGNFLYSMRSKVGHLVDFNLALDLAVRTRKRPANENNCLLPGDITFTEQRKMLVKSSKLETDETRTDRALKRLLSIEHNSQQSVSLGPVQMTRKPLREYVMKNISNPACKRVRLTPTPLTIKPLATAYPLRDPYQRRTACVGTKGYSSPEVLLGSPQTVKVDIWSAGVTLLQLATGKLPFSSGGAPKTIHDIAKLRGTKDLKQLGSSLLLEELKHDSDGIPISDWANSSNLPSSFLDLIDKCLRVNPEERISARDAMQHDFFSPCLRARTETRISKMLQPGSRSAPFTNLSETNLAAGV